MKNASSKTARVLDLTVVVSCYDHQAYIEQCLDSIVAQSVAPRQVIIIDDYSNDDSARLISLWLSDRDFGYTFIQHDKNVGVCATLNEALAIAEGRYFCHVSGDDWEDPDRFRHQVDFFDSGKSDVAVLIGDIREVDVSGGTIVEHDFSQRVATLIGSSRSSALAALLEENVIPAPGTMLRTSALTAIDGFDDSLAFEDYDMWMRLASQYAFAYSPGIVSNYRVIDSGLTRNIDRRVSVLTSEADMLAKHIGTSPENDIRIAARLLQITGDIVLLGSVPGVRHVLEKAMFASSARWIRDAYRVSRTKSGLQTLVKSHATDLGLKPEIVVPQPVKAMRR